MFRNVKKFGIELEGGWDIRPRDYQLYHSDGSVTVDGKWKVGEIVSPILTRWAQGADFMRANYPDNTGASCGLHVHMSFGNRNEECLSQLADSEEYMRRLLANLAALAKRRRITSRAFWSRMEGENDYCKTVWQKRNVREPDRYNAVNFTAYNRHGTVEVRILPMFSRRDIAIRFVRRVLSFTDLYLSRYDKAPVEVSRAIEHGPEEPLILATVERDVY